MGMSAERVPRPGSERVIIDLASQRAVSYDSPEGRAALKGDGFAAREAERISREQPKRTAEQEAATLLLMKSVARRENHLLRGAIAELEKGLQHADRQYQDHLRNQNQSAVHAWKQESQRLQQEILKRHALINVLASGIEALKTGQAPSRELFSLLTELETQALAWEQQIGEHATQTPDMYTQAVNRCLELQQLRANIGPKIGRAEGRI